MASVASQLIEEVTAHAQSDSPGDAQEICADGTYFLNNLHNIQLHVSALYVGHHQVVQSHLISSLDNLMMAYIQG